MNGKFVFRSLLSTINGKEEEEHFVMFLSFPAGQESFYSMGSLIKELIVKK